MKRKQIDIFIPNMDSHVKKEMTDDVFNYIGIAIEGRLYEFLWLKLGELHFQALLTRKYSK